MQPGEPVIRYHTSPGGTTETLENPSQLKPHFLAFFQNANAFRPLYPGFLPGLDSLVPPGPVFDQTKGFHLMGALYTKQALIG